MSTGVEGAEVDDVVEGDAEAGSSKRRQSIAVRNLRLIRNFVRRNLRVLERSEFRSGVGAGVVIPNIIILNWMCWWVATKDGERPGELMDERLRLWRLLWGSGESGGYLDELGEEQRGLVLGRFDDQRFEIVTLASMAVWDAACASLGVIEARAAVANALGASFSEVSAKEQPVVVGSTSVPRPVCEMSMPVTLGPGDAERAFAAWRGVDDRDYYRLKWKGGVALYRTAEESGWVYTESDDEMVDLGFIAASDPPWRVELDRLYYAVEAAAEAAA